MTACDFVCHPTEALRGVVSVPGDKSLSHRALILGAIAKGVTTIDGFLDSEDCLATLRAFESMGVLIERPKVASIILHGVGKHGLRAPNQPIDCGNSGTTMRLLAGLLAAQTFDSELYGDKSLSKRPMNRVAHPLNAMGASVTTQDGCSPISIQGDRRLKGMTYILKEASAQVKTALLLAGMYADGPVSVIEQAHTRDHTERMLEAFSYPIQICGHRITIDPEAECEGAAIRIPKDVSSAAFFIVAATLIPGSELHIRAVGINSRRTGMLRVLELMGADIRFSRQRRYGQEPVADLTIRHASLRGIEIPASMVSSAIDEFPVLFIAAACASGQTVLRGAQELRYKESDRIAVMAHGLQRLGIEVHTFEDGILIQGGQLRGGTVDSFGDHRVAMSFAVAGALASEPVTVLNCAEVSTSFPGFVQTAKHVKMPIQVNYHGDVIYV